MQTGPAVKNVKQSLMFAHKGKPDKTLKQQTLWICVLLLIYAAFTVHWENANE